jgi:hypothetical protein
MKPKSTLRQAPLFIGCAITLVMNFADEAKADIPLIDPEITLTGSAPLRAVQGAVLNPVSFSATNLNAGAATTFNLGLTLGSVGQLNSLSVPALPSGTTVTNAAGTPWIGVSLGAGVNGTIRATPNISGLTAGQTMNFGIQATQATWNAPVAASSSINVVSNRLLTGSTTINAGRHIAGLQSIGSVTLSGGALTGSEGTNISIHSGGYAQLANGLRLTSATNFTFNGAGQTHDLQISYNRPTGAYNISGASLPSTNTYTDASGSQRQEFGGAWKTSAQYGNLFGEKRTFTEDSRSGWDALPGNDRSWQRRGTSGSSSGDYIYHQEIATTGQPGFSNTRSLQVGPLNSAWELQRGAGALVNERINPLVSGEVIQGSSLDLSGVSFNITGTAVTDRTISGGQIDLGRRMQGSANQTISRTDSLTLTTFGSDDHRTRLSLAEFDLNSNGVTTAHTGVSAFTESNHTAAVQITGNFTIDTSVAGRVTHGINAGSSISGEDLAGENKQSSLQLGYTWNNVQNNELFARDLLIIDSNTASGTRNYSTHAGQVHSTETHTNIGVAGNNVQVTGTRSTGIHNLGNRTVTAIAEGLVGENATASASFNTRYASVASATFTATNTGATAGPLTDGNTITLRDTGSSVFQNNVGITNIALSGGQNLEYQLI